MKSGMMSYVVTSIKWHIFISPIENIKMHAIQAGNIIFNPLMQNGHYSGHTALLTSRRCILNIYSTNIRAEYFKHAA
jgi:hypothetical protein